MGYENVKLWFAKDNDTNIITIDEVKESNTYNCPICGSEVKPVAIGGKTKDGNISKRSSHFAHVDASKCNGESMIHFWFKHKFLVVGDKFTVISDKRREYVCKEVLVEQSYAVDGREYKPDVTILTECGETIYFEMDYSNSKKIQDYIDVWLKLGNIVVEVDIKSLVNSTINQIPIFNAKYYNGKCFNIKGVENTEYHRTIGDFKESHSHDYEKHKKEFEKLDWLWREIMEYKLGNNNIINISRSIRNIDNEDSRKVVVGILKNTSCQNIIKEYIEYNNNEILNYIKIANLESKCLDNGIRLEVRTNIPRKIYDRLYTTTGIHLKMFTLKGNILINDIPIRSSRTIDRIPIKINDRIKLIDDLLEWFDVNFNCDRQYPNIIFRHTPNINYYYSSFNGEHRLYLNRFKNSFHGDYISYEKHKTIEEGLNYMLEKLDYDNLFTKDEIEYINESHKNLTNSSISDNFEIKFFINNLDNLEIGVFCKKLKNYSYYFELCKNDVINVNLYDYILNIISDIKNKTFATYNCIGCKETFDISCGEALFYINKNLTRPKRCKKCRDKKKQKQ